MRRKAPRAGEQLTWLLSASARLALPHDLDEVLDTIVTCVCEGLDYDRVGIFLLEYDAEGRLLETEVRGNDEVGRPTRGRPDLPAVVDDATLAADSPDLHHLRCGHSYYYCADRWAITPPHQRWTLDGRMSQQLAVALRRDDVLVGYISVDNLISQRPIVEADAPPLVAFAAQAALAISRAQLWAERDAQAQTLRNRVAELEWLREVGRRVTAAVTLDELLDTVYDSIREKWGYDRVSIGLEDADTLTAREYLGTDATGQETRSVEHVISIAHDNWVWMLPGVAAVRAGADFYYTEDAMGICPAELATAVGSLPRHLLQVALRSGTQVTGLISVDNHLSGRPIAVEEARPLVALAHLVGTAVENARLHERERAERERLEQAALTDHLTGIGNHRAFHEALHQEVAYARRHHLPLALALVDLDDFKVINDRTGHVGGDLVLAALGQVLQGGRLEDRPFRLGGDEFALLLRGTPLRDALIVVQRLCVEARQALGGATLSVGFAGAREPGDEWQSLREQADAALYEAKRRGRNTIVSFDDVRDSITVTSPAKTEAVRRLLAEGRLAVALQPIWDLAQLRLLGYEALSRPTAEYGLHGPQEAFEIARILGRVPELDALCRQAILARAAALPPHALLFFNVAQASLEHASLAGTALLEAAGAAGLPPDRVVLEITERPGADLAAFVREARRLQEMGFQLALDDAGAGNIGLELLSRLPVEFVKIDRALVVRAMSDSTARAVLAALVAYARHTNTYVIAEGIETETMLDFVRRVDAAPGATRGSIHGVQGNLLGRPGDPFTDSLPAALRPPGSASGALTIVPTPAPPRRAARERAGGHRPS